MKQILYKKTRILRLYIFILLNLIFILLTILFFYPSSGIKILFVESFLLLLICLFVFLVFINRKYIKNIFKPNPEYKLRDLIFIILSLLIFVFECSLIVATFLTLVI